MENKKVFFLVLTLLASTFLLVSAYHFFLKKGVGLPGLKEEPKTGQEELGLSGKIYLSLLTLDDIDRISKQSNKFQNRREGISASSDIYYYDLINKELKKIGRDTKDKNGYTTGVISPDGKQIAMGGVDSASGEWQIYVADKNGKNKRKITNSSSVHKELPQWSSDQKQIVFQANSEDKKDMERNDIYMIENWNVYLTDTAGNERMIFSGGIDPMFLPDDRLLILTPYGLMIFDKKDNYAKGAMVWPIAGKDKANQSMRVSVSNDGKYIAWTETRARKTHVAKVASWGPPIVFEKLKTFDGILICPVFSPDNKYMALLEVLLDSSVTSENYDYNGHYDSRVNIYDLPALLSSSEKIIKPKTTFNLDGYFFGSADVTDWAQ